MITRIEIDGFKSFKDFAVDLEPLTAVVGANSVGKSNLFEALQLLARLIDMDILPALQGGRGRVADQFRRTVDGSLNHMRFAVELLLSANTEGCDVLAKDNLAADGGLAQTRVRYELGIERRSLGAGVEELVIASEKALPIHEAADRWLTRHPELRGFARYGVEAPFLSVGHLALRVSEVAEYDGHGYLIDDGLKAMGGLPRNASATSMNRLRGAFGPHLWALSRELRGWRFLQVGAMELRGRSEPTAGVVLAADGANLPTVIAAAPVAATAQIQADLAELMPGLRSLRVTAGEEFGLEVEFSDGLRLPARILSDGTLRMVAFLTALRLAPPGSVVGIEEPEMGSIQGASAPWSRNSSRPQAPHGNSPSRCS